MTDGSEGPRPFRYSEGTWFTPGPGEAIYVFINESGSEVMRIAELGSAMVSKSMKGRGRLAEQVGNAHRIVACVNACAGLPTDLLENLQPGQLKVECLDAALLRGEEYRVLRQENDQLKRQLAEVQRWIENRPLAS